MVASDLRERGRKTRGGGKKGCESPSGTGDGHDDKVGRYRTLRTGSPSDFLETLAKLGTTATNNHTYFREEIKSQLNSRNVYF